MRGNRWAYNFREFDIIQVYIKKNILIIVMIFGFSISQIESYIECELLARPDWTKKRLYLLYMSLQRYHNEARNAMWMGDYDFYLARSARDLHNKQTISITIYHQSGTNYYMHGLTRLPRHWPRHTDWKTIHLYKVAASTSREDGQYKLK